MPAGGMLHIRFRCSCSPVATTSWIRRRAGFLKRTGGPWMRSASFAATPESGCADPVLRRRDTRRHGNVDGLRNTTVYLVVCAQIVAVSYVNRAVKHALKGAHEKVLF